jgi:ABC-type sulfate transport system permease component
MSKGRFLARILIFATFIILTTIAALLVYQSQNSRSSTWEVLEQTYAREKLRTAISFAGISNRAATTG